MPIDKNEFDRGKKDDWVAKRILSFLKRNKDKGFDSSEIIRGIGYKIRDDRLVWEVLGYMAFHRTLDDLVKDGRVIKKKVSYNDYYMFK